MAAMKFKKNFCYKFLFYINLEIRKFNLIQWKRKSLWKSIWWSPDIKFWSKLIQIYLNVIEIFVDLNSQSFKIWWFYIKLLLTVIKSTSLVKTDKCSLK